MSTTAKIIAILVLGSVVTVSLLSWKPKMLGGPMIMNDFQWDYSFSGALYDTPSGNLEKGYYTVVQDGYLIQIRSEYISTPFPYPTSTVITGLIKANKIGEAYYDVFRNSEDVTIYIRSTAKDYQALARSGSPIVGVLSQSSLQNIYALWNALPLKVALNATST